MIEPLLAAQVLLAAVFHAGWNMLAKRASGGLPMVWLFGLVSSVLVLPVAGWIAPRVAAFSWQAWLLVVASALVHLAYSLVLQRGYRLAPLSVVYPIARGSGPLLSTIGAALLLGESPGWIGLLGVFAIAMGIGLLAQTPGPTTFDRRGVGYGLLTGLLIASYTVIDGVAMAQLGLNALAFYCLVLWVRTICLAPFAWHRRTELLDQARRIPLEILGIGVLSPLAYWMVLDALHNAPLSVVAPLREVSMLIAVLGASFLLRERLRRRQWFGVTLMLGGVFALL